MSKPDGGPAFPCTAPDSQLRAALLKAHTDGLPLSMRQVGDLSSQFPGMTLRDWFAGLALQGMLAANPTPPQKMTAETIDSVLSREAYLSADAMLVERCKP